MLNIPLTNRINYYSKRLSGDYLRLYFESVDNLSRGFFNTTLTFESSEEENLQAGLDAVIEAIIYGCPELFFVSQKVEMSWSGRRVSLTFSNRYAGKNITEMWNKLDAEINRIVEKTL